MTAFDLVLLLLLAATWGGLLWVYRRLSGDLDELARERVEQAELQSNIASMVAQLQHAADELGEALALRTGKLQELLAQADRRVAELGAGRRAEAGAPATVPPRVQVQEAPPAAPAPVITPQGNGRHAALSAAAMPSPPAAGAGESIMAAAKVPHAASYDEVRRLAAEGLDPAEIAKRTQRGREEVRLLLQLGQASTAQRSQSRDYQSRDGARSKS